MAKNLFTVSSMGNRGSLVEPQTVFFRYVPCRLSSLASIEKNCEVKCGTTVYDQHLHSLSSHLTCSYLRLVGIPRGGNRWSCRILGERTRHLLQLCHVMFSGTNSNLHYYLTCFHTYHTVRVRELIIRGNNFITILYVCMHTVRLPVIMLQYEYITSTWYDTYRN